MDLRSDKGDTIRLLSPLTRAGGEGQVFEIEGSSTRVAKLYHQPADSQKAPKLRYQVQFPVPALSKIAAWPTELLLEPSDPRIVRGIIMQRMPGKEIHKLYGPADRQAEFPTAGWDFLIHVAMNCAAVFETLHEHGVVMADVNEGNLLVKETDGTVGLIDCDSYQIRNGGSHYLCDVGVPMWTPPELQGLNFRGLERTPNHDRFGLAVIIFRLLFMGRHPFVGNPSARDQIAIEESIKQFMFAFSKETWARGVRQPPHSLSLLALPESLRRLFERAFLQGSSHPNARPSGQEWSQALKALLPALKKGCIDPGHKYWHGLTSCPWCEITNAGGPNFFISVSVHLGSLDLMADFKTFWAVITRVVQGPLMRESVTVPIIGRSKPRPMPLEKPVVPSMARPIVPTKPPPLTKPVAAALQLPVPPTPKPPSAIAKIPMGPNESIARICGLGACFFALFIVLSYNLQVVAAMYGAVWAFATCVVVIMVKSGSARHEREKGREVERMARKQERQQAEEEYARQMALYDEQVKMLTNQHAAAVARAEAEYLYGWQQQDQEYQKQYNSYLVAQREYEGTVKTYETQCVRWTAECDLRRANEKQLRLRLHTEVNDLKNSLHVYQKHVEAQFPALEAARIQFERSKTDEIVDMRKLHQQRQVLQIRQYLASQLIQDAPIPKIGKLKKATLGAYGYGSAWDVHADMRLPGFGDVLVGYLMAWRKQCESQFRYNPNIPLPPAEVRAVKIKYAQRRQSALVELRGGAARLEALESKTRSALTQARMEILKLARAHAQAVADVEVCS